MTAIPNTAPNAGLADAVNSRIAADGRMLSAKAALWRMGGFGLLAAGLGTAVLLGCYGYARIRDVSVTADQLAQEIKTALTTGNLKVSLDPGAKVAMDADKNLVRLEPGATVEARGSVALDPNASIKVTGNIIAQNQGPRLTEQQLSRDAQPQSKKQVSTIYTVFKEVPFGQGKVETGWQFDPDQPDYPQSQFCHFMQMSPDGDTTGIIMNLARNGQFLPPKKVINGFNARQAAASCVWFNNNPTSF